jgi:hypothetical protein
MTRIRRVFTMNAADFRQIALSLEGAEEGSHMGAADFRVGGRIFATLASQKEGYGKLILTPEVQAEFVGEAPEIFVPIHGGRGRMGMTHIRLAKATADILAGALWAAWRIRAEENKKSKSKRPPRRSGWAKGGMRSCPDAAIATGANSLRG